MIKPYLIGSSRFAGKLSSAQTNPIIGAMKKYSRPQTIDQRDADARQLAAGRLETGFLIGGFFAFILGMQIRHRCKNKNQKPHGREDADAQIGSGQAGIGIRCRGRRHWWYW